MSSSRLTTLQVHERFKQNYNTLYSKMIPKEDLFDDSLTNLQWLQNLNVNIANPVPPVPMGNSPDGTKRVNMAYRKIRGGDIGINRYKPRTGDVAQAHNLDSPVKGDPGSQSMERQNAQRLESRLLNGNSKSKSKNSKKNPLPPLIPQSRTPLPSQYRSRVGPQRDSQKDSLPRLSGSNDSLKLNTKLCENAITLTASPELALLSDTRNQYVLSPRQMDRDLLPGQVDYKNNPYVKPPFSHLALICMALRRNRDKKMTVQKICEWIKNNFIYYRCVGPDWQNSIRDNLVRHKCFERVGRKNDAAGKAGFWRIDAKYEEKFSSGMLRKRRLASAGEVKGQPSSASDKSSSRGCSPSIEQCCDYDFLRPEDFADGDISGDEFLDGEGFSGSKKTSSAGSSNKGSAGQKRKQATPQKIAKSKKSKQQQQQQQLQQPKAEKINLFEDQAPELGYLKGEFTFTSILEEMRLNGSHCGSSVNSSLSLPNTPNLAASRKSRGNAPTSATMTSNESLFTDVMLPIDPSLLLTSSGGSVHIPNSSPLNLDMDTVPHDLIDDFFNTDKHARASIESLGRRRGTALNTPTFELDPNDDFDIGISKSVEALDLTVTGSKIEPPDGWIPDPTTLDLVLGEKQDNFGLTELDLGVGAYDFSDFCDINDENSPRGKKKKARRRPGSASSGTGSTNTSPRRPANHLSMPPQLKTSSRASSHTWQETKTATDTIQSILGTEFDDLL
ncbi:uncharacterized protein LOC120346425 [Styela clava]